MKVNGELKNAQVEATTTANRPTPALKGRVLYDVTIGQLIHDNGVVWEVLQTETSSYKKTETYTKTEVDAHASFSEKSGKIAWKAAYGLDGTPGSCISSDKVSVGTGIVWAGDTRQEFKYTGLIVGKFYRVTWNLHVEVNIPEGENYNIVFHTPKLRKSDDSDDINILPLSNNGVALDMCNNIGFKTTALRDHDVDATTDDSGHTFQMTMFFKCPAGYEGSKIDIETKEQLSAGSYIACIFSTLEEWDDVTIHPSIT